MFMQETSGPLSLCPMKIGTSETSARKFWLPLLLRVIKSVVSDPGMSCLPPASIKVWQCYNLSVSLQIVFTVLTGHKASPLCPISGLVKNKINNKTTGHFESMHMQFPESCVFLAGWFWHFTMNHCLWTPDMKLVESNQQIMTLQRIWGLSDNSLLLFHCWLHSL